MERKRAHAHGPPSSTGTPHVFCGPIRFLGPLAGRRGGLAVEGKCNDCDQGDQRTSSWWLEMRLPRPLAIIGVRDGFTESHPTDEAKTKSDARCPDERGASATGRRVRDALRCEAKPAAVLTCHHHRRRHAFDVTLPMLTRLPRLSAKRDGGLAPGGRRAQWACLYCFPFYCCTTIVR